MIKRHHIKPSILCLRPGPIRDKARELAKEHYFMDMIDKGYDPYLIREDQIKSAITVLLFNTGDHFFMLAEQAINGKANGSKP